jgi:ADP-ribosylation factor GTPase-activating protein 2/3
MGVHISFVRSSKMDRWKLKELKNMENGGNKLAREFYDENGMMESGKPDHKNPSLQRYKNELKLKVDEALGVLAQAAPVK